jgi:transposase
VYKFSFKENGMSSVTLGIDISKAKLDVALYQSEQYHLATFSNNKDGYRRLAKWLKKRRAKGAHVCIEATGRYGEEVALYMHGRGYPVSLVNPARIKAYASSQLKRNKTDQEDAKVIAHFCATQQPSLWTPPPPEVRELQALTRHLESLKADRTRELNRKQSGVPSEMVVQSIDEHIAFLDDQITALEKQIQDLIDQHPTLRQKRDLLTSIPGIGNNAAAKFIAEVPDVSRFDSAAQLAAFAGLTPRNHHSGSSVHRRGRLVKTGSVRFRTAFYMPALAAMRYNPIIQTFVARLTARGKSRMVIVGAVMRKLVHLAYGVLKHGQPFDPNYLVNGRDAA